MSEKEEYEELRQLAEAREEAEKAGVFDDDREYEPQLTLAQEMTLHYATSDLSRLMKETNSSLSDLLKMGGLDV